MEELSVWQETPIRVKRHAMIGRAVPQHIKINQQVNSGQFNQHPVKTSPNKETGNPNIDE